MKTRGQIQLSFGMIFSIIIIIATVAVAFYFIRTFLTTSDCERVRLFYAALDKEVDTIWRSPSARVSFVNDVPSSVTGMCFGDPKQLDSKQYVRESAILSQYAFSDKNLHIYPESECGSSTTAHLIGHASIPKSFCITATKGKIALHLSKSNPSEAQVTITP